MKRLISSMVACLAFGTWSSADGHHPVSESGISWVEPVNIVELSAEASGFDFGDGFSGNWQAVSIGAEWRIIDRFSLSARIPTAHLALDDGRRVVGLADIEASAKYRIAATEHGGFIASAGIGAGFPTGSVELGLGAGHFELSPFVMMSTRPVDWLAVYGAAIDKLSLGDASDAQPIDERAPHGSIIAPHQPHEMDVRLGVAILPSDHLYSSLRVEQTTVFDGVGPGPTRGRFEVGWTRRGDVRIAAGLSHHIAGTRRQLLGVELNAALFF
jgi:hypothetical protein